MIPYPVQVSVAARDSVSVDLSISYQIEGRAYFLVWVPDAVAVGQTAEVGQTDRPLAALTLDQVIKLKMSLQEALGQLREGQLPPPAEVDSRDEAFEINRQRKVAEAEAIKLRADAGLPGDHFEADGKSWVLTESGFELAPAESQDDD